MTDQESKFWLNTVLDAAEEKYPDGEIIISSGISPSASYHIGHFREILSAELISIGLRLRGRKTRHLHVVDNFDPLRKRYDFLPEEYEQYVGWPVCLVPDPYDCHESYADHFFQEFYQWVQRLNIDAEVVNSYKDLYKSGKMAPQIEKAVAGVDRIKEIFKEVSNRDLPDDWMPLQLLSDNNSFNEWRFVSIDTDKKTIEWRDEEGNTGDMSYDSGRVKLSWRLDWPARWEVLGVQIEPHGFQEHGASGGSFQTGKLFAKDIFGIEPPIAGFQYGHVHLAGDTIKMSSSKGNLITPEEAFSVMPPEMLRYFYARYPGKKRIDFDPGLGFYRMMDEFSQVELAALNGEDHQFKPAYDIAVYGLTSGNVTSIPFNHLVSIYQAALGEYDEVINILRRTGYEKAVQDEADELKNELDFVAAWLDKWAPEEVKFTLQEKVPDIDLSEAQLKLLNMLADKIENEPHDSSDGSWYHNLIHEVREEAGLDAKDAFSTVYHVILAKDSGPKAGWFLSMLDDEWIVKRFRQET